MSNLFNKWLTILQNVDWGQAVAVLLTGIVVVFSALIVLVCVFWAFGKIMAIIGNAGEKKATKTAAKAEPAEKKLVEIVSEDGLSDEIIAALTGAVSVILSEEGASGSYVIKSIRRTRPASSAWGNAGVLDNTRPF